MARGKRGVKSTCIRVFRESTKGMIKGWLKRGKDVREGGPGLKGKEGRRMREKGRKERSPKADLIHLKNSD